MVEAAPQARPEDNLGGIDRSSFVAEYNLGLTSALQHCQHNGAFRFLAAQVSGPPFQFLANFGTQIVFFGMRVCRSRFLKILGSESGCLGLQNQAFGVGGISKNSFSHMLGLCRFWHHFYMVFYGFGTNFDDFWWLGDRLEIS